jgi:hypothetical protein
MISPQNGQFVFGTTQRYAGLGQLKQAYTYAAVIDKHAVTSCNEARFQAALAQLL